MERRYALIKHTHFLSDLEDFFVSSPADGDVLEYDSTASNWVNVPIASLSGLDEAVQDIAALALTDTATIDFTYNDGTGLITADVLPAGVNHNALLNYVADQHVAHSGVTLTAGAGLTGGGDITVSRALTVGAGTGITVNADDVALSAATIASLLLADSSIQPGDSNALLTNGAGYITSASLPVGANPTGTVGLSAVNGSATTFLRSDGAPALDQGIVPTWTGTHTWDATAGNIKIGTTAVQSSAPISSRGQRAGNSFEWGHASQSGFGSTIGYGVNNGSPFIAMFAEAGTTANSFTTRGQPAAILHASAGAFNFGSVASSNAANQTFVEGLRLSPSTGTVLSGNGSAALPSLASLADPNTGIYWPASDDLWMSLGGTGYPIGYRGIPARTSSVAATTPVQTDDGRIVMPITGATSVSLGALAEGTTIVLPNSAAALAVSSSSGSLFWFSGSAVISGSRTLAAGGVATVVRFGSNWYMWGSGIT